MNDLAESESCEDAVPHLPAKSAFAAMPVTYLNSGATHPLPLGARRALDAYARHKTLDRTGPPLDMVGKDRHVLAMFASLVGATPQELSFTQSTSMAENLVLNALGFPDQAARVVTDRLHFSGSLYTYARLVQAGADVVAVPMNRDGEVAIEAIAAAMNDKTRLIAVSLVSSLNGFEHDLHALCEMAHAQGAYVYADIVHAAGAMPVDLHACGVDFAASSSYKWLMGDFGLAFLYASKAVQRQLRPNWWGYYQLEGHHEQTAMPGADALDASCYNNLDNAQGLFAMGTMCRTGVALLDYSLAWIQRLGVEAIQTHRQPLIEAIQGELRRRGYQPLTPLTSRSPLVAFALKDAKAKLHELLGQRQVAIALAPDRFRISVAAFNDMNDVDRLLWAIPKIPPT